MGKASNKEFAETVARRIRVLREQSGIPIMELAYRVGVTSISSVSRWESGAGLPSAYFIVRLARIFGVSTDYLLGVTEEKE